MEKTILHCDINSFYASVEELYHPETRGLPMAVGGSTDQRHGIILSRNQLAKKDGVVAAEAIWQAKAKCPNLIIYPPNYQRYILFSQKIRKIFHDYTDLVEPFGLDEAWLDVTASGIYGTGEEIADKLRERIFNELGVTCSVGVSFNKIFAKLGSDLRKPNYTTIISKDNYKEVVWPLKAGELLYVGKSTEKRLNELNIRTIGDIANAKTDLLKKYLGKWGLMLWRFANGYQDDPVARYDAKDLVKSISNGVTCYRDLASWQDIEVVMQVLCESVAARLKEQNFKAKEVTVYLRDNQLSWFSRQMQVPATNLSDELMQAVKKLVKDNYFFQVPLRSVSIRASKLTSSDDVQLSLFINQKQREKQLLLEQTIDDIRSRYGFESIKRLSVMLDPALTNFNPKDDHTIFPESYLR